MRPAALAFAATGFIASAALAAGVAFFAVNEIEQSTARAAKTALAASGQIWANVEATGTQIILRGTAPDEKKRLQALGAVSAVISTDRIDNQTDVAESVPISEPEFALEILRNGLDISLIGITPKRTSGDPIESALGKIDGVSLIDMHENTDWPMPEGWYEAVDFGSAIATEMERAKISITPATVNVTAVVASAAEKTRLIQYLQSGRPDRVTLNIEITAPRPIFAPYSLTFMLSQDGAKLQCQALTKTGSATIVAAAVAAGLESPSDCDIGLGAPTDNWANIAAAAIKTVTKMQGGMLEMQDSGITITAPEDFDPLVFAGLVEDLSHILPKAYVLHAILPHKQAAEGAKAKPWFTATLAETGKVVLQGVAIDAVSQKTLEAYGEAQFGYENIKDTTEIAEFAPHGWTAHQLAALDVLALLDAGRINVTEDAVTVTGEGKIPDLKGEIKGLLEQGFGAGASLTINVREVIPTPESLTLPDAKICESDIAAVLNQKQILFAPGKASIEPSSADTITKIATILNRCNSAWFEVAGYTDNQGGENLNRNLSQARADAVIDALLARNLLLGYLTATGYGEADPLGDNATEKGRQKNRRIEIRFLEGTPALAAAKIAAEAEAAAKAALGAPSTPERRPADLTILPVDFTNTAATENTHGQN